VITLHGGPAGGEALDLRRAPQLLRVVIGPGGRVDALDQLDDRPKPRERIVVYRRTSRPLWYHLKATKKSLSGYYLSADYQWMVNQPDDATARETESWRAWAIANQDP
jgi:hypothetical protein